MDSKTIVVMILCLLSAGYAFSEDIQSDLKRRLVNYQTDDRAIELLEQAKDIQLIWRNILIIGSVILVVTLIRIYRLQRLRALKAKELIKTQKKLNSKLKETHQLTKLREAVATMPEVSSGSSIDDKFILRARSVVDRYMGDADFGVEKLAEEMHLSRAQLFRRMKALLGISPSEFTNNIRLQKAAELIRAKADTLTQISYSVGFNEQSYFAKRFRKKFGVTPREYSRFPK